MKYITFIVLIILMSCKNETSKDDVSKIEEDKKVGVPNETKEFDLAIYDYKELEPLINVKDDNVHIVNFWATWCAPCVKELPYFEAIREKYAKDNIEVLLVSLDFKKDYETKLKSFVLDKNIQSKVVALYDMDQNTWIPAVDKDWTGAIPATIIYKGDKRKFYEQSFTQEELETELKTFLN